MPTAIPLAVTIIATAAGASATTVAIVSFISSMAVSYFMAESARRGANDIAQGIRANVRTPAAALPVVYGRARLGGNDVFIEATGPNNNHLWLVQTLAEGECNGIYQSGGVDQVWLGDKLYSEYGGNVSYTFHSGSGSQTVDAALNAAIAKYDDNLRHTCYLAWKLTFDKNYFQNLPNRTVEIEGRKLYDPRDGSTAYSNNPALALYDFLTNTRYGFGFDSSNIDEVTFANAANYCDEKGFTINMVISEGTSAQQVLDQICILFRGQLVWYDNKFYLRYADLNYEAASMTLTDEHIVQSENGTAQVTINQPGAFDVPDGLRVRFVDADKGYVEDAVMIGDVSGTIEEIVLHGCTSREHASNIGTYLLERMKLNRTITGLFRDDALRLEPHDIVNFSSTALGISDQLMRVLEANIMPDGLIELTLQYESSELYDDDYDVDIEDEYTCILPDITAEPPTVSDVSISEETYSYRLRTFTRLKVSFSEPTGWPWFSHVEVYVSRDNVNWEHQFNATEDFSIENVEEGADYYIRLKTVSIHGVKTPDEHDYKLYHHVLGQNTEPDSVAGLDAIVSANQISLYSNKVTSPDVELYEFRLGSTWSSGIFLAALRGPNLVLPGVKPGSHTFGVNTLSNNGQYGGTPRFTSVYLPEPPTGYSIVHSFTCDYQESGEDHDNTEHYLYNSGDWLKCSHNSLGLTGTYLSPVYDAGLSDDFLVYVLADVTVIGAGTTWDDVIPIPTTWDEINISSRTWREIFTLENAPQVSMSILYGNQNPPTNEIPRMEILYGIVTGRYFQVKITITDPSYPVNALVEAFTLRLCQ